MARFEETLDRAFDQGLASIVGGPLFDLGSMSLRPLYSIGVSHSMLKVVFDLPHVEDRKDVDLNVGEDAIWMEAKTGTPVRLGLSGPRTRHAEFERYVVRLRLPVMVEAEKATARLAGGLLTVKVPVRHRGKTIRVR